MNVTVLIPRALQPACEGRSKIELGVPPASGLGDVVLTLMTLYPGLRAYVANEKRPLKQHFGVAQVGRKVLLFTASVGSSRADRA
ncbi:MAG: hypothetical protein K1X64_11855 [Myxococcaceae bacterium]|nr:hypothetical protein [Myxococcaceae bacterium]